MQTDRRLILGLIETCREVIAVHADHLCALDRAIGDGDHGTNMRRGCDAVYFERESLSELPFDRAVERIGLTLVMNVGGASGPLYGTLLIEMGRQLGKAAHNEAFALVLRRAIDAVARRGRSQEGDKTLLDVLYPVQSAVARQAGLIHIADTATQSAALTAGMKAMRGRASFLGERSVGHVDPGASSCALLATAICHYLEEYGPV